MPEFEAPVGPERERNAGLIWPAGWEDENPFLKPYSLKGRDAIHTGADLNHRADVGAGVYAMGKGVVTYAADPFPKKGVWGGLIVIYHGRVDGDHIYSRYGHVQGVVVNRGDPVTKGQHIARIAGKDPALGFDPHLHFDISKTEKLRENPGYWPWEDKGMVEFHFVNPKAWLLHRKQKEQAAPKAAPVRAIDVPGTAPKQDATELRYVTRPAGAKVHKDHHTAAAVVHELRHGASVPLKAGGPYPVQDGFVWAQISGGEFHGYWVAVSIKEPKKPEDQFLSKKSPL